MGKHWPESLTNASGILWHATFMMRDRAVDIQELWNGLREFTITLSIFLLIAPRLSVSLLLQSMMIKQLPMLSAELSMQFFSRAIRIG